MKNPIIRGKLFALAAASALALSLCACSAGPEPGPSASGQPQSAPSGESYTVAIVKQMDHASLDEIADAICARLDEIAQETGAGIEYKVYSGLDGSPDLLNQIGAQVLSEGVDAIVPVATTAAQLMASAAEESETPVIFAAVSDPDIAGLTGIDYVTGVSDALNTPFILDMMLAQDPGIEKVGLLYSLSEPNSAAPIADAKAYLAERGISCVEATGNTSDEIIQAAGTLIAAGVDAVFTPTDNVVMSAEPAIYQDFIDAGIPHYTGADSFVRSGAYATCGVNYTGLGRDTAELTYRALTEGMDGLEDFYLADGGIITVNTETAGALDLDSSVFQDMGQVVGVLTTGE